MSNPYKIAKRFIKFQILSVMVQLDLWQVAFSLDLLGHEEEILETIRKKKRGKKDSDTGSCKVSREVENFTFDKKKTGHGWKIS